MAIPDADGDGFNEAQDCDDRNANINPSKPEVLDNDVDENCDGVEGVNLDRDSDGFQRPADCNDGNPGIHPGVTDVPDNKVDENCDGSDAESPPPPTITASVSVLFSKSTAKATKFTKFQVKGVPAGSTIVAKCTKCGKKAPKQTIRNAKGTVRLKKFVRAIKAGAVIKVTITHPGMVGVVKLVKVRKRSNPTITTRCYHQAPPAR